ncbi:MAG: haloacid dehalogenase type II [Terriglobia bacterium]
MPRPIRLKDVQAITFDCYGTLIDWETGARQTLRDLLARRRLRADAAAFFRDWEHSQRQRIQQRYARYHEIVAATFLEVAQRYALPLTPADATAFADAIPRWNPFPDVPQALGALKRHLRLGIISNIDDALLAGSVAQMKVAFDLKMTAEQAQAYKPAARPFELALERLALPPTLVAHAAFGFEYDIVTASRLGFRTILVRRGRTQFPPQPVPDLVVSDLAELAAAFS